MENVTDRESNPFGMEPPCEGYVPGYGDPNAHFHVVGDSPAIHGGGDSGYPFTGTEAAERLQTVLARGGLLEATGTPPLVDRTYLSYLYPCTESDPDEADYARLEPFFDAELRAITAHVLLPVGARATAHLLETVTTRSAADVDMDDLHASEVSRGGWLVVPVADPGTWTTGEETALVDRLGSIRNRDYRRAADLGRFLADGDSYLVR